MIFFREIYSDNTSWIPTFAGMTQQLNILSFLRKQESKGVRNLNL